VFIGSTLAPELYAFETATGRLLWTGNLPASPKSTPMTLQGPDDKQYVIVSAGGFGIPGMSPLGDYIVAFRL
jgi:quinoprotein glucose dehydrogenase